MIYPVPIYCSCCATKKVAMEYEDRIVVRHRYGDGKVHVMVLLKNTKSCDITSLEKVKIE